MTGVSLSNFRRGESARMSSSTGHFHVVMPFSNGVDDRVTIRLATQLAENDKVKVTIVHVEDTPESLEALAAIQRMIPSTVNDRVTFLSRTNESLIAAVGAVLQGDEAEGRTEAGDMPDNLILVGRNSDTRTSDGSLPDADKVLGSYASGCVRLLSQIRAKSSVLVVQARRD